MTKYSREIERKFRVKDLHLKHVAGYLRVLLAKNIDRELVECATSDLYFNTPEGINIIRLRDSWGMSNSGFSKSLKEITIKIKDHKTNFNRLEENVKVLDSESAYRLLTLAFGEPKLTLDKEEVVLWTKDKMIISLALVDGDPDIFLEVEGPTEELVQVYVKKIKKVFPTMKAESRSLLEIFG